MTGYRHDADEGTAMKMSAKNEQLEGFQGALRDSRIEFLVIDEILPETSCKRRTHEELASLAQRLKELIPDFPRIVRPGRIIEDD
jgi:hypothetical protein